MEKIYKLDGLDVYITGAKTKSHAAYACVCNRIGVTEENIVEIERMPNNEIVREIKFGSGEEWWNR